MTMVLAKKVFALGDDWELPPVCEVVHVAQIDRMDFDSTKYTRGFAMAYGLVTNIPELHVWYKWNPDDFNNVSLEDRCHSRYRGFVCARNHSLHDDEPDWHYSPPGLSIANWTTDMEDHW